MSTLAFSSARRSGAPTLHASLRGSGALVETKPSILRYGLHLAIHDAALSSIMHTALWGLLDEVPRSLRPLTSFSTPPCLLLYTLFASFSTPP